MIDLEGNLGTLNIRLKGKQNILSETKRIGSNKIFEDIKLCHIEKA